jgi:hypothetical protein
MVWLSMGLVVIVVLVCTVMAIVHCMSSAWMVGLVRAVLALQSKCWCLDMQQEKCKGPWVINHDGARQSGHSGSSSIAKHMDSTRNCAGCCLSGG